MNATKTRPTGTLFLIAARVLAEWIGLAAAGCIGAIAVSKPLHTLGVDNIVPQFGMMAGTSALAIGFMFRVALLDKELDIFKPWHRVAIRWVVPVIVGMIFGFSRL